MIRTITILLFLFLIGGCAPSYESAYQAPSGSYLQVQGDLQGLTMNVDGHPVSLKNITTFNDNGVKAAKFPISDGKHLLKMNKGDLVIIEQYFYSSNGETYKVNTK